MSEQQIIARLVELCRSLALDDNDSPQAAEFDRLKTQLDEQVGEFRMSCILDRILFEMGKL